MKTSEKLIRSDLSELRYKAVEIAVEVWNGSCRLHGLQAPLWLPHSPLAILSLAFTVTRGWHWSSQSQLPHGAGKGCTAAIRNRGKHVATMFPLARGTGFRWFLFPPFHQQGQLSSPGQCQPSNLLISLCLLFAVKRRKVRLQNYTHLAISSHNPFSL